MTDGTIQVAWCGDARAYHLTDGGLTRLTTDHNLRQELLDRGVTPGIYARNTVTSYLGDTIEKPALGEIAVPATGRLILASDGAYEPIEDSCRDMRHYLTGSPAAAARTLVQAAIDHAGHRPDNATTLIADLT